jgi:hypothetical protein
MSLPEIEDRYDYPIYMMGEHPDIEYILEFNTKSSILIEANLENGCAGTEVQ